MSLFAQMFCLVLSTLPLNHCLGKVPLLVREGVKACVVYLGRYGRTVGPTMSMNKVALCIPACNGGHLFTHSV